MHKFFDLSFDPVIDEAEKLYFINDGNIVSFCTYFNAVSVGKIKKYTTAECVIIKAEAESETRIEIHYAGTVNGVIRSLTGLHFEIRIKVSDIPDSAQLLYITCEGGKIKAASVFLEGKERDAAVCFITCTYKREKQLARNIGYLLEKSDGNDFDIIIADNGSTLDAALFDYERVTVIKNINNGGSGGYRAGMEEAVRRKKYTHFILMDDDVVIEYNALQKVIGFLRFLKDDYSDLSICGAMLNLSQPCVQFESGGHFSEDGIQTGFCYSNDVSVPEGLLRDENEKDINYAAWWLVCMPSVYAEHGEYPAPFFIKYDDVEYSLRCRMKIISLCGFGVWHEDFGSKYNSVAEYFNTRNYLFLMKWHSSGFSNKAAYKKARYLLLEKLCRQQYKMAEAVIIAYEDFLKGEKYLADTDYSQKLEELKKLNYDLISDDELMRKYKLAFDKALYDQCSTKKFKRYMQLFLYGQAVPSFLCRKLTVTDVISDRKEHYFGAGRVLHYSVSDHKGYVTERSLIKTIKLIIKFIFIHYKFSGGKK